MNSGVSDQNTVLQIHSLEAFAIPSQLGEATVGEEGAAGELDVSESFAVLRQCNQRFVGYLIALREIQILQMRTALSDMQHRVIYHETRPQVESDYAVHVTLNSVETPLG